MARKKPAPISLKKPQRKKAAPVVAPVREFNKDAPEHAEPRIIKKIVKDKALEARVALLEGAGKPDIIVNLPVRPRIESIAIEYDSLGHPKVLVPAYSE